MHPRLAEVMRFVEVKRDELLRSIDGISSKRLASRASEESWSVAEILEHLRLVENSVAKVITVRGDEAKARGVAQEKATTSVLGSLDRFEIAEGTTPMLPPLSSDSRLRAALSGRRLNR